MDFEEAIKSLTAWLDAVDTATAGAGVTAALERNAQKDSAAELPPMFSRRRIDDDGAMARLALHESAHGCVAHALGLRVSRILVRSNGGSAAYAADELRGDTCVALLIATLAGPALEVLAGVPHPSSLARLSRGYDILAARLRLDELPPEWAVSARGAATLAVSTVASCRESIARVACALLNAPSGELDGATIDALCGSAR